MPAAFVIKCLEVIENGHASLLLGFEHPIWGKAFAFERGKEALACGVIVTIAYRAHALNPTEVVQLLTHLVAGILAATI